MRETMLRRMTVRRSAVLRMTVRRSAVLLAVPALAGLVATAAPTPARAAAPLDACVQPVEGRSPRPATAVPAGTADDPVVVGVKPLDPFVTRSEGTCSGFSVELWDEVSRRNGWISVYAWEDTLAPLLTATQNRRVDAAIAGISITRDREEQLDFSYPMFNAGLQIMVSRTGSGSGGLFGVFGEVIGFLTASLAKFLLVLLAGLFLAGNVVWLVTRRKPDRDGDADPDPAPSPDPDPDHRPRRGTGPRSQPYLSGLGEGMWKAAAVGLAADLGHVRRPAARFVSVAWLIVGVCFVSLFTAAVTSRLTVGQIRTDIAGVSDLTGKEVVTVAGSTAAAYLDDRGLRYEKVQKIEDAYVLLAKGKADAIVFDAPVLQHQALKTPGTVLLVGPVFKPEDYGIAMPLDSPLRKKVNATLLDMRADGSYERIYQRYFGAQGA